jgi:hypothetical protein
LRFHTAAEGKLLGGSFALHVVSGIAQVLLVLYYFPGGGDMLGYYREGVALASLLRADFVEFAPRILLAFLQQDVQLPFEITTGGGATASMTAASAFVLFVSGDSLYASVQVVGIAAYLSQVMMYRALRAGVRPEQHQALLAGLLLLPSAVFWSSALLKEPLVFCSLGPLLLALQWLASGVRRVSAVLIGLPAAVVIAVLKPYVLIALSVGGAVYYLSIRFRSRVVALRPFAIVTALALSFGGMTLAARFFTKADAESAASALATQRRVGYDVEGGSNYYLDRSEGDDVANRSLAQELALAPLALITACYRPFLFEARNSVQLVNAIEATALLVISVQLVRRRRWRVVASEIRQSPVLAFCAAFTLVLAVGTGLATSNLGTLSRYRAPMMPFFFALLMVLRQPLTVAPSWARRGLVGPSVRPVEAE